MSDPIRIAVGRDITNWHDHFAGALESKKRAGYPLEYGIILLEGHDWLRAVEPFDAVIWKPANMGPQSAAQFQAKVYFLEEYAGKTVVPCYRNIWHFENKVAQSYVFEALKVPTPETIASFDYHDAMAVLRDEPFPLVFKEPAGAGSRNVRLVPDLETAQRLVTDVFSQQIWFENKMRLGSSVKLFLHGAFTRWYWAKIRRLLRGEENFRSVYWQHFVPGQTGDIRITVIGDSRAYAFRRGNRPNDFRASGSGRLDYTTPVPEEAVRYCIGLNRILGVDSMAYDILYLDGRMVINEMSYAYMDYALHDCPGTYRLLDNGTLEFIEGRVRPQTLWVEWTLERIQREKATIAPSSVPASAGTGGVSTSA